jgi:hypothetical protein
LVKTVLELLHHHHHLHHHLLLHLHRHHHHHHLPVPLTKVWVAVVMETVPLIVPEFVEATVVANYWRSYI